MINIFISILELIINLILMTSFLNIKLINRQKVHWLLIYVAANIVIIPLLNLQPSELIVFSLQTAIMVIPTYFYLQCTVKEFILGMLLNYSLVILIQLPASIIFPIILPNMNYEEMSVIGSLYTIIVELVIRKFADLHRIYNFLFGVKKTGTFIAANIFSLLVIISLYFKVYPNSYAENLIFIIVSIIIVVTMNLIMSNQLVKITHQRKQIEAYNMYLPVLEEVISGLRERQHSYTNEIQAIIGLMYTHKDYGSLTDAMNKMINHSTYDSIPDYLTKLNMYMVSGFLYQKQQYAASMGRTIHFSFETYELHSSVPEYDLVDFFGILLDNAIEAVGPGDTVFVSVKSKDNTISFTTRNRGYVLSQSDYTNFFMNGYSKKPECSINKKHSGLGLYHLRNMVINHYHGEITLWNEGTDILFEIRL